MSKQQSLLAFVSQTHSPPSPKVPRVDEDAVVQALSASSSSELDESDTEQVSATQVDTEAKLEESSSTVASRITYS